MDFIPKLQGWFNTFKLISLIYHKLKNNNHIISIDAEWIINKVPTYLHNKNPRDLTTDEAYLKMQGYI